MVDERDQQLLRVLRIVAPGTALREGMESILRARTGGLIVVGDSPQVMSMVDGGFRIDSDFLPAYIYELAKMDGAIILSHDLKRILYANAHLSPDPAIPSFETGIRHRTAERTAKQTGELVIAISQRRNIISLYKGNSRYILRETGAILNKANQALQTLEKYKSVLDQVLTNLSGLELEDSVTAMDAALAVQRAQLVLRIVREVERYVLELGTEGRLVDLQLEELAGTVEEECSLVVRDYIAPEVDSAAVLLALSAFPADDLPDLAGVARVMGMGGGPGALETPQVPRGYRILRKIPRLPMPVIENLVSRFGSLQPILQASISELDDVEGIGEVRARLIKEGLRRLREQVMLERHV